MSLIDNIPIGERYKISREELMKKSGIKDIRTFRTDLKTLHQEYVIIYDEGYYLPAGIEEYQKYIDKLEYEKLKITAKINLAKKLMKKQ